MSQITKEQIAEWEQREAAYYAEAKRWKQLEEKMKRQQAEQLAQWKRNDEAWEKFYKDQEKFQKDQEELTKYTEEEIKEAIHQIRIDRLKIILNPYVQ